MCPPGLGGIGAGTELSALGPSEIKPRKSAISANNPGSSMVENHPSRPNFAVFGAWNRRVHSSPHVDKLKPVNNLIRVH